MVLAGLMGGLPSAGLLAQKRNINPGWDFLRLTDATSTEEIKNQGADWSSQYNIEHVRSAQQKLAVAQETLQQEFARLEQRQWEKVELPHTPQVEPLTVLHQWQGVCYYRKHLSVSSREAEGRLWLEFEGAMHLADVWINGRHMMQHAGGYTPFVIDATGVLHAGEDNEVLVRLDNRDNPLIPPGKPLGSLDFNYFGGIYRDVNLIAKSGVHLTDPIQSRRAESGIFVTYPQVSAEKAVVRIHAEVCNAEATEKDAALRHTLYEWKTGKGRGRKVAVAEEAVRLAPGTDKGVNLEMALTGPRLWYPDAPNLYLLLTEVLCDGKVTDTEETRIGIRRVDMSQQQGCVINGKPYKLVGANRHQEYPYVGYALSDNAQYRDMYQMRANGFNVVRLGHYPQDVSTLDACDELGLLAIEPIPGWQFFNRDTTFIALTHRDVRDLIRRDRNHPSVIMWETTLNESWPPEEWKDAVVKLAHEEYPGDQCFTSGDTYGYDGFDVCYNDWEDGFRRPNNTSKPSFIREYYDYEFGGHYSTSRVRRGDGERAQLQNLWNAQWSWNRYVADYPKTMGGAVWSMHDYNRGCCDNICYSGLADLFRLPKFGLSFFRTQVPAGAWTPAGKMPYEVFVASYRADEMSDTLMVLGNVEEVRLLLNGREIARKGPDNGPSTEYVTSADGGNAEHLECPPFTFMNVPREKGVLVAEGYAGGKKVAVCTVRTPEERAARLAISYFESGRPAGRHDLIIVNVELLDGNGTLCPQNHVPVRLAVLSGGEVVGPADYASECGVSSFLVRTADVSRLVLEARSGSLNARKAIKLK